MKKILLMLAAFMAVSVCSFAAEWNKPVPPDCTILNGVTFYLYNPAQDKFVNHDGMTINLSSEGIAITAVEQPSGDYKFATSEDCYLYANFDFVCSNGTVDDANTDWYIEKQSDATYLIRPSKNDPDHSWADYPDCWMGYCHDTYFVSPLVLAEDGDIKWNAISEDDMACFMLLRKLDAVMTELQGYGYDVKDLLAVYNNESATKADIDDAINSVDSILANYRIGNATEDNPIDVTSIYMRNPSFTEDWVDDGHDLTGWTMEPSYFCGMGTGSADGTFYDDDKVISSWAGAAFADSRISQTLTNLRNGKYRFGNYGIWIRHTGEDGDPLEGAYIYAKVGDKTYRRMLTDTGWWRGLSEVEFECRSGEAEVGIIFEGTNVGQCIIYDFRLEYMGEDTPASRVKNLINNSQAIIDAAQVNSKYITTLTADITKGQTLIADNAEAELETFYYQFLSNYEEGQKNADSYPTLAALIESANQTLVLGDSEDMNVLSDYLINNELEDKYQAFAFDNEQMDEVISTLTALIEKASNSVILPDQDITNLVTNADFSAANGWEHTEDEDGPAYDTSKKLMTKWWNDWEADQTLTNLPNGTYRLEVQAFQWNSWDWGQAQSQWDAGDGSNPAYDVTTYIRLNDSSAAICNVFSCGANNLTEGYDAGYYIVPNSESGALQLFEQGYYQNSVEGEVTDHTLRIMLDCRTNGFWNCFYNLHLFYVGVSTSINVPYSEDIHSSDDSPAYNLMGMKVDEASAHGIIIKNGKKFYIK